MANGVTPSSKLTPAPGPQRGAPQTGGRGLPPPALARFPATGTPSQPNFARSGIAQGIGEAGAVLGSGLARLGQRRLRAAEKMADRKHEFALIEKQAQERREAQQRDAINQAFANKSVSLMNGVDRDMMLMNDLFSRVMSNPANPDFFASPEGREAMRSMLALRKRLEAGRFDIGTETLAALVSSPNDPEQLVDAASRMTARTASLLGLPGANAPPLARDDGRLDGEVAAAKASALTVAEIVYQVSALEAKYTNNSRALDRVAKETEKRMTEQGLRRQAMAEAMYGYVQRDAGSLMGAQEDFALGITSLLEQDSGLPAMNGADILASVGRNLGPRGALLSTTAEAMAQYTAPGPRSLEQWLETGGDQERMIPLLDGMQGVAIPALLNLIQPAPPKTTFTITEVDPDGTERIVEHERAANEPFLQLHRSIHADPAKLDRVRLMLSRLIQFNAGLMTTKTVADHATKQEFAGMIGKYGALSDEFSEAQGREPDMIEGLALLERVFDDPELRGLVQTLRDMQIPQDEDGAAMMQEVQRSERRMLGQPTGLPRVRDEVEMLP